MEQKKQYPKPIGAVWIKQGNYGDYLSISLEIEGVKHSFVAYPNKFYEVGSNKPQYNIQPPKAPTQTQQAVNKYEAQLNSVMAQKAAVEQKKVQLQAVATTTIEQASFTEEDLPF